MNNNNRLSRDAYRSVVLPSNAPSVFERVAGPSNRVSLGQKGTNSVVGESEIEICTPPSLPGDIGSFPLQPYHAVLKGPYYQVFDVVGASITNCGTGVKVRRAIKEEGRYICEMEEMNGRYTEFNIALWQLPGDQVLMELIVLADDSAYSWGQFFKRLCVHNNTKPYVVKSIPSGKLANQPFGQFVQPVF